ncbi:hypothetical protein [Azospirillum palustre]
MEHLERRETEIRACSIVPQVQPADGSFYHAAGAEISAA